MPDLHHSKDNTNNMKIALFGGTGKAGRHLLEALLEVGHEVTALVRTPQNLLMSHANLKIVQGDVLEAEPVLQALEGQEIVISAISEGTTPVRKTQSGGIANILAAMQQKGIRRIICMGGAGLLQFNQTERVNEQPWFPAMLKDVALEHMEVLRLLQTSSFEWTIVCPPMILNAPHDGKFMVTADHAPTQNNEVNAGNIADFIAEELTARIFVNKRVGITNA